MANSSKYWQNRFETMHDAILKDGTGCYDDAERLFRKASDSIQSDIVKWYMRLAENNQMTLAEAQKLLRDDELKEFHWTVEEYIKRGHASKQWAKELENASAKFHISRLEALQLQMQQHLEELYGGYTDDLDKAMGDTYRQGYYKTAYNIQTGIHMGFDIGQIPKDQVDIVLKKPWAADGQSFSDRIWTDKAKLLNNLEDILTQGLVRGDPLQKMAKELSHRMDVSLSNAARLITTESAFFASKGEYDCMKELGVEEYEFVATLDRRTSDICQSMDGKVIPMKDFKPGVTAPPLHCYCRSCTVPHVEDVKIKMKRAARDQKTGKTILIDDMPYNDWYSIFVEKKQSYENWKKARDAAVAGATSGVVNSLMENTTKLADAMSEDDYRAYIERVKDSPMAEMYAKYGDDLDEVKIVKSDMFSDESGYYRNNKIVFDYDSGKEKYNTLAHEYGHFFAEKADYRSATFDEFDHFWGLLGIKKGRYDVSLSDQFISALRSDKPKAIELWKQRGDDYNDIASADVQDTIRGFGAATKWGHDSSYYYFYANMAMKNWKDIKKLYNRLGFNVKKKFDIADLAMDYQTAKETFANMTSAYTLSNRPAIAYYEKYLPETWSAFKKLINDAKGKAGKTESKSAIMKLPGYEKAVIPDAKFTKYALDPMKDKDKAKAFKLALGYDQSNYQDLIKNIRQHLDQFPAQEKMTDKYGTRYEVLLQLTGPNGKTANVITAWIVDTTGNTRLVSVYVKEKKVKNEN